jgi:hypothetical protein
MPESVLNTVKTSLTTAFSCLFLNHNWQAFLLKIPADSAPGLVEFV